MTAAEALKAGVVLKKVYPGYPAEARRIRAAGAGKAILEIDPATGRVSRAYMSVSTDSAALDQAALHAFQQWEFSPGAISRLEIPISFGANLDKVENGRSMRDILDSYVGKGTTVEASMPRYPEPVTGTRRGKGVYEIRVNKWGGGCKMKVLQSSGDGIFDRAVRVAVGGWKFSRGPFVIELPLTFSITPTATRIDVAR